MPVSSAEGFPFATAGSPSGNMAIPMFVGPPHHAAVMFGGERARLLILNRLHASDYFQLQSMRPPLTPWTQSLSRTPCPGDNAPRTFCFRASCDTLVRVPYS